MQVGSGNFFYTSPNTIEEELIGWLAVHETRIHYYT